MVYTETLVLPSNLAVISSNQNTYLSSTFYHDMIEWSNVILIKDF